MKGLLGSSEIWCEGLGYGVKGLCLMYGSVSSVRGSRLGCELGYEGIIWHQWVSGVRVGLGCAEK